MPRRRYALNIRTKKMSTSPDDSAVEKGLIFENIISSKLTEAGIKHSFMPIHASFDIIALGVVKIDVKGASRAIHPPTVNTPFFNFRVRGKKVKDRDVLIFYIEPLDSFYCIPNQLLSDRETFRVYSNPKRTAKEYLPYLNNFDAILSFPHKSIT